MASHRRNRPFADDLKVKWRIRLDRFGSIDAKDLKILEALQVNARVPLSELGRSVGLSQPAVSERVRRLEECSHAIKRL